MKAICVIADSHNGAGKGHDSHRVVAGLGDAVHLQSLLVCNSDQGSAVAQHFGLITLKLALNLFEGATGCHEWEAGFLLAELILGNANLFRGVFRTTTLQINTTVCFVDCI